MYLIPLYVGLLALPPIFAGFLILELVELLGKQDIKRAKKETELFI